MEAQTPEHLRHDDDGNPPNDKAAGADDRAEPKQSWLATWRARIVGHPWIVAGVILGLVLVVAASVLWWLHARQFETTDDAFIDARIVTISARISGAIESVSVNDNQMVEAGAVLMRIDDRTYQAQLDQAKAQVDEAKANVANLDAQIAAQQARIEASNRQVEQAKPAVTFAEEENARYQKLAASGSGTLQQAQQSRSNLLQAQAALATAQANAEAAQLQQRVLGTQRRAAEAQEEAAEARQSLAEANLSYTVVTAPVTGRITKLTAAKGVYIAPGQALSMFVPRDVWVTANFKESQLNLMRPGQPVDLSVDAFPGRSFHGRIDSIQAGSGTAFSLLPAENATGNYVKVVQRVPVKITFDQPPDVQLGPGMSVVPRVTVR